MQLCDAGGCVFPKDYPFTADLRPDVKPVTVPKASGSAAKPMSDSPSTSPPAAGQPANPPPTGAAAHPSTAGGNEPPPVPAATNPTTVAPAVVISTEKTTKPSTAIKGEIRWLPFTNASDLKQIVGPDFNLEKIRANMRESVRQENAGMGVLGAIFAGFVGGLLLNIMPCVLPVIGLKIVSFVEQAGHNRRKAFMLNLWYAAGLLTVFLILASLAVGPQRLGWGELFGRAWFSITLTCVVFVMALSFMGVWEVPIARLPGQRQSGLVGAPRKKGAVGAYFKGYFDYVPGHPLQRPVPGHRPGLGHRQPRVADFHLFIRSGWAWPALTFRSALIPNCSASCPSPVRGWKRSSVMGFVLLGTVVYLLAVLRAGLRRAHRGLALQPLVHVLVGRTAQAGKIYGEFAGMGFRGHGCRRGMDPDVPRL